MPRQQFDQSSKWLLQHHGKAILFLGGAVNVRSCRALQAEVVQPRQLPDGLLEVRFRDRTPPDYVVVEVATYPERRLLDQALADLLLTYQHLRVLPELLTVVLHPKGRLRIAGTREVRSRLGWSRLAGQWKVVELWTLKAEDLLAADDVSLVPWVPLTHYAGPPEALLEQCRQRIERQGPLAEQENLLAVSQVLARLRYNDPHLLALLGGKQAMIESPLIKELLAERTQKDILEFLEGRFGPVPQEVKTRLGKIVSEKRLTALIKWAAQCPDLEAFRERLLA